MNCRDDCAGLCFLGRFCEEVSDQWIRPTEKNFLSKQRTSKGASLFMKCPGQVSAVRYLTALPVWSRTGVSIYIGEISWL
jgi:hypothetical protein